MDESAIPAWSRESAAQASISRGEFATPRRLSQHTPRTRILLTHRTPLGKPSHPHPPPSPIRALVHAPCAHLWWGVVRCLASPLCLVASEFPDDGAGHRRAATYSGRMDAAPFLVCSIQMIEPPTLLICMMEGDHWTRLGKKLASETGPNRLEDVRNAIDI